MGEETVLLSIPFYLLTHGQSGVSAHEVLRKAQVFRETHDSVEDVPIECQTSSPSFIDISRLFDLPLI